MNTIAPAPSPVSPEQVAREWCRRRGCEPARIRRTVELPTPHKVKRWVWHEPYWGPSHLPFPLDLLAGGMSQPSEAEAFELLGVALLACQQVSSDL